MAFTEDTQVVVLLGGLGTRLKDIAPDTPKPMVDIHGKPFFYYQLELMKWHGFKDFVFCIGHKGKVVEDYFKDGREFGVNIQYSYDGEKLLGTGGAIRRALPLLKEDFLIIYGDSYMDVDYEEIIYNYSREKSLHNQKGLMTVYRNKNRYDKSNVVFKDNILVNYDKVNTLPEMEYIDYGISILNRGVIEAIPEGQFTDLAGVFNKLVLGREMAGYEVRNRFYEIGTPPSLYEFREYVAERFNTPKPAIFLDRDGTLNEIVFNEDIEALDSPLKPEEFKFLPGTVDALKILKLMGYLLIVVTNQPSAAKGKVHLGQLYNVNNRMRDLLAGEDIYLDDVLMCPHHPDYKEGLKEPFLIQKCNCRKPKPGLIEKALKKFNIDIENSYMAGDSHVDVLAGQAVNLQTVFLGRYKCDLCQLMGEHKPNLTFKNLYEFAVFLKNTHKE